jgi:hypothetical protein
MSEISGGIKQAPLSSTSLTYAASLTPSCAEGLRRKVTCTGNVTLNAPTNARDGMTWEGTFHASAADRTITLNAAIKVPSGFSGVENPTTIPSGARWFVQLKYNGDMAAWWLTAWTGGFS